MTQAYPARIFNLISKSFRHSHPTRKAEKFWNQTKLAFYSCFVNSVMAARQEVKAKMFMFNKTDGSTILILITSTVNI